jgi:glycosyltransferase involved in cell wall biosynthesis
MTGLRVTFLLPCSGHVPVGGVKVVYEYANHLVSRGYEVAVVHSAFRYPDESPAMKFRHSAAYLYRRLTQRYRPTAWFPVNASVKLIWVPSLAERFVPDGDIVIATAWQSAEYCSYYPPSKGRKFYLIQHLEVWDGMGEKVYATWKSPLQKIVIARWLQEIAHNLGQEATFIPNGLDSGVFSLERPPEDRDANAVAMLYHREAWKGSHDGIKALSMVRELVPNLRVTLFGVPPRPPHLPHWFEYRRCASQALLQQIYNDAAIFVAPSLTEGWGLPATEAMMCGAALAATDIGGHREFALHRETALLSSPGNIDQLTENILLLIREPAVRLRIAKNGHAFVQQFTWERSVNALEALLLGNQGKK